MVLVNDPASIWVQLASFSFFAAGFFSDILIVRLSLASAYTFLLINASLGSPLWPNIRRANALSLDGLIWAVLNLYVLFSGIARLLMDESQVTFASDEEEALWRLFYRLGGVSRKVFQSNICRHMKVVHCKPGQKLSVESNFYILYKGIVNLDIYDKDQVIATGQDGSGSMFDFKNLGLLHNEKRFKSQRLDVVVVQDATLFQFSNDSIRAMSAVPKVKSVWQTIFLENLSRIVCNLETAGYQQQQPHEQAMPPTWRKDFIDPLFHPLNETEEPQPFYRAGSGQTFPNALFWHIGYSAYHSFRWPWPLGGHLIGLRHDSLPAPTKNSLKKPSLVTATDDDSSRRNVLNKSFRMTKQIFHDANDDAKYSSLLQTRKELKAELITYFCLKQSNNPNVVSVEVDLDTTV